MTENARILARAVMHALRDIGDAGTADADTGLQMMTARINDCANHCANQNHTNAARRAQLLRGFSCALVDEFEKGDTRRPMLS